MRRKALLSVMTKLIGVMAIIAIVAAVGKTAYKASRMETKLEWDYLNKIYDGSGKVKPRSTGDKSRYDQNKTADLSRARDYRNPRIGLVQPVDVVDLSSPKPAGIDPVTEAAGVQNIETKQNAIASVVKEFFEARSVSEMLPLVRDAHRVRPLMEEYYTRKKLDAASWKGMASARSTMDPGYHFAYVQSLFNDRPPSFVLVEETEKGFLVDWESSVQYSEQDWQDFQNKRPGEPKVFRVLASESEAVPNGTSDSKITIKLKHPQDAGVLYGSFDRNDPRFRPLLQQLESCQWKNAPVILRLCYPGPTAAVNEVQIAGVEGKGWIILDSQPHS